MLPERSLLICTSPRSGSNWLCDMLGKTEQCGRPAEYFSVSSDRFYERQLGRGAIACYPKVFDYILRLGSTPNRRFSTKLFWLQLQELETYFHNSDEYLGFDGLAILEDQLPNISVLRLSRSDYLRQAISHYRALNTQVWWNNSEIAVPRGLDCHYDHRSIRRLLLMLVDWEKSWAGRLSAYKHPQLLITYAEMRHNLVDVLSHVLEFLDIKMDPTKLAEKTNFRVQADTLTDLWVKQFLEEDAGQSSAAIDCDLARELAPDDRPIQVQVPIVPLSEGPRSNQTDCLRKMTVKDGASV